MRTKRNCGLQAVVLCSSMLGLLGLAGSGCGVKEYFNCQSICEKKKMCGPDSNYNVDNCVDNCSTNANKDPDYARRVDTCKECTDPLSCTDPKLVTCFVSCPSL